MRRLRIPRIPGFHPHNHMRLHPRFGFGLKTQMLNGQKLVNVIGLRPLEPDSNPANHGAGFVPRKFISS